MAGIYLHIPFCRKACTYCDFHFSTNLSSVTSMVEAMKREIEIQREYLDGELVNTIYFGGGTPSVLDEKSINGLLVAIHQNFPVTADVETTLEANPDDLDRSKLEELKKSGINRLSIGIQSFENEHLQWMNRTHNAEEAVNSVKNAQEIGIDNISIDLIYALPGCENYWESNLEKAIDLNVQHLSCYALTVEEKTLLYNQLKKDEVQLPTDEKVEEEFLFMVDFLKEVGFEQYEISNFCHENSLSRHNSAYWLGKKYLGIGPSAHSFDGKSRQWNIRNNHQYIKGIEASEVLFEKEVLSSASRFNEYVLTLLRTKWGINFKEMLDEYGVDFLHRFKLEVDQYEKRGLIRIDNERIFLTRRGGLFADKIAGDFFIGDV